MIWLYIRLINSYLRLTFNSGYQTFKMHWNTLKGDKLGWSGHHFLCLETKKTWAVGGELCIFYISSNIKRDYFGEVGWTKPMVLHRTSAWRVGEKHTTFNRKLQQGKISHNRTNLNELFVLGNSLLLWKGKLDSGIYYSFHFKCWRYYT